MTRMNQKRTELSMLARRLAAPVQGRGATYDFAADGLSRQSADDRVQREAERDALAAIAAMPRREQSYLGIAHYWACRAPRGEYQDWRNELYIRMVEAQKPAALAFNESRCDWIKLWKRYVRQREFSVAFSAPGPGADDSYVDRTMGDIAAESCYVSDIADYVCDELDTAALWSKLNTNPRLVGIVSKRLRGEALRGADRVYLHRWLSEHRTELVTA